MVESNLNIGTVIIAVALTVAVMSGIFYLGLVLSDEKLVTIEGDIREFEVERRSQEISRRIAENLPERNCDALNLAVEQTIQDTQELENEVIRYERNNKIDREEFNFLKKEYTNVLLEYWLMTEKVKEMCDSDTVTLLYFYSDEQDCPECGDQGTILSHYREKYDEDLLVFPLDTTLDMRPINILVDTYEFDVFPVIKVEDEIYEGFMDKEELGEILELHMEN